jgi:glutamate racemase
LSAAARPIAVFDSGVGGLTVYRAIRRRLPGESLAYFGDTAHVPYGTKSPDTVRRLTRTHVSFLLRRGVKAVVIACNTASAVAMEALAAAASRVPVVGVIEPGVRMALERTRSGRIGVIGTTTTIASQAYQRRLVAAGRGVSVHARACPLFVPLAEEGWARHPIARRIAADYLAPLIRARVDTLILGCTHYPLLASTIREVMGSRVELVDSAEAVQRELGAALRARGLLRRAPAGRPARGPEPV